MEKKNKQNVFVNKAAFDFRNVIIISEWIKDNVPSKVWNQTKAWTDFEIFIL